MRIRMEVDVSGDRNGKPWPRHGQEVDLPEGEAIALCASGMATPVNKSVETATAPEAEVPRQPEPEKAVTSGEEQRDKPKRGRPQGSKNRPKPEDVSDGD